MRFVRTLPYVAGAVTAALLVGGWCAWRSASGSTVEARAPRAIACDPEELARFLDELQRFRAGERGLESSLAERAERLAACGRPDARRVVAYYAALSPAELARGLAIDAEHERLWSRVEEALAERYTPDEWREERDEILASIARSLDDARDAADRVPAARLRSLRARLFVERVETDDELDPNDANDLLDRARDDALSAASAFEAAGMVKPVLEPLWLLGRVARAKGDVAGAEERFAQCLARAKEVVNDDFERHALEGLLDASRRRGDVGRATWILHELARSSDVSASWTLVRAQADLLLASDEPDRAGELLASHPPDDPRERWDWRLRRIGALTRARRFDEARTLLPSTLDEPASSAGASTRPSETRARAVARLARALVDLRSGSAERALAAVERSLAELPHDAAELEAAAWIAAEAELALGRDADAAKRLERALASAEADQARLVRARARAASDGIAGEGIAGNVVGERLGLHALALYAEALRRGGRALDAAVAIERHQSQLLRGALSHGDAEPLDADALRAWARRFERGLVTWVIGADAGVVAWVGADGTARAASIARGRGELELASRRLRQAMIAGDDRRADEIAIALQAELFPAAVADEIAASDGGVLLLVHGPVEGLALERLPLFASGRALACLPGLPEARPGEALALDPSAAWSLCGAPLDANGDELLPGAADELERIAELRPSSRVATGERFDRAAMLEALASGRPLHVATHLVRGECGAFAGASAPLGLELGGGASFCAREIADARPMLPIAVLSACETGGGTFVDAQGLQGVARAFLESGTRDLLVTSWPVEDRAARDAAIAFHRALVEGLAPSRAAARARSELRAAGYASADWAAFRALGRD